MKKGLTNETSCQMNTYQNYLSQAKAFAINVKCGIGRLYSRLVTLYGTIFAYIQTVINREMPSLHVKDIPPCEKESIMKVHVFESKGLWYFHVKSSNGKIVAQSEGYKQKASALKTIKALKSGMCNAKVIE